MTRSNGRIMRRTQQTNAAPDAHTHRHNPTHKPTDALPLDALCACLEPWSFLTWIGEAETRACATGRKKSC